MNKLLHTKTPWQTSGFRVYTGEHDGGIARVIADFNLARIRPQERMTDAEFAEAVANLQLFIAAPVMYAACVRLIEECPFICDADSCECGENGNGFDNDGNPCEHIQACRAIALAEGK